MPWQKKVESFFEHGTTLVLDLVAFNALSGFASVGGRVVVGQLRTAMEEGVLFTEQYAVEAAGFGKLIIEEGPEAATRAADAIKNDLALFKASSNETIAQKIHNSIGRVANTANERGKAYEKFLVKKFGGRDSFKVKTAKSSREFDGVVGNIWYEAKSGKYWDTLLSNKKVLETFKERMGTGLKIARENGAKYELYSETPIPQEIKDWLTSKEIPFKEIPLEEFWEGR